VSVQGPTSSPTPLHALLGIEPRAAKPARPTAPSEPAAEPATLWDLLTPEERSFFQQLATTGRLAYGPGGRADEPPPAVPTGQRIDVRG
jgi:hypothetical protein